MTASLTPVMGIGVGSFLGRWRSLLLLVLEKVEPESGMQDSAWRVTGCSSSSSTSSTSSSSRSSSRRSSSSSSSSSSERIVLGVHVIVNRVDFTLCNRRDYWVSDSSCEDHSLGFLDLGWGWRGGSSVSSFSVLCRAGVAVLEELTRVVLLHDFVKDLGACKAHGRGWDGGRCR